jgi:hypothetical protein
MSRKKTLSILLGIVVVLASTLFVAKSMHQNSAEDSKEKPPQEYLQIVGMRFLNNKDRLGGAQTIFSLYSIAQHKVVENYALGNVALYPVACMDFAHKKIYYSGSDNNLYDNLYVYDIVSKQSKQLTHDKMLFNDLFMVGDTLIGNVAPEGKTCVQAAIFHPGQGKVNYYNAHDDDTWFHSLSYNPITGTLLALTCSDQEMRSDRVATQTHICPKQIILMNPDFSDSKMIYKTEAFEIGETRQLDAHRILMITNKQMGSGGPRQLQILNLDNDTVDKLNIEGLIEPQSVCPDRSGEHLYILGRSSTSPLSLFDYDIKEHKLTDLLAGYQFPSGHKVVVDFTYVSLP